MQTKRVEIFIHKSDIFDCLDDVVRDSIEDALRLNNIDSSRIYNYNGLGDGVYLTVDVELERLKNIKS